VLLRLSLSEKPSQFSVELPIRVKVPIHESSHHVSRQRGYLLTITARMNLDPFPGTVTPSRRSVLHRARPVEQSRHGIVSGNNDTAARGIAAAILRRYRSALFRIPPRRVVAGQRPRKLRWPIALTRRALRGSPARFLASPLCSLSAIAASEAHMRRMLALMSQCKLDSGVREQCLKNGATARREHEAPPCARAPKGPSRSCSAPSHVNS